MLYINLSDMRHFTNVKDLGDLKETNKMIAQTIESTEYDSIIKNLVDTGLLSSESESPEFVIKAKDGTKIAVTMSGAHDDQFEVDTSLAAKSTLDMVPDQYKKVSITLDKKAMEADFNAGVLPSALKRFCSKNPVDITKLKVAFVKEEEDK